MQIQERNTSKIARVGQDKQCVIEDYLSHLHGGLGNLYVCDGLPGDMLHLEANIRIGEQASLTQAIRGAVALLAKRARAGIGQRI